MPGVGVLAYQQFYTYTYTSLWPTTTTNTPIVVLVQIISVFVYIWLFSSEKGPWFRFSKENFPLAICKCLHRYATFLVKMVYNNDKLYPFLFCADFNTTRSHYELLTHIVINHEFYYFIRVFERTPDFDMFPKNPPKSMRVISYILAVKPIGEAPISTHDLCVCRTSINGPRWWVGGRQWVRMSNKNEDSDRILQLK